MQTLVEFMNRDRLKKYKSYNYFPEDKYELKRTINKLIKERGNKADFNDIDTSKIDDMSFLFDRTSFDGDISRWNVSSVESMEGMFWQAKNFDQNLDEWNINPRCNISSIFYGCPLEKHPPKWYKK